MAPPRNRDGSHEQAIGALGRELGALLGRYRRLSGREAQQRSNLSYAQWRLLSALADEQELSARQLAEAAAVSAASVTRMLEQLVEQGIVERKRDDGDRRVVRNRLTPAGIALFHERTAAYDAKFAEALSGLGDDELLSGVAVLRRLRSFFELL